MAEVRHSVDVDAARETAYELVSRVEAYGDFITDCDSVDVLERSDDGILAELSLGLGRVTGRFRCVEPERVRMELVNGPLGNLEGTWWFAVLGDDKTRIELAVAYKSSNFARDALLRPAVDRISRRLLASVADELGSRGPA
jgi:ribosome-associated toxin RatA of RatAB toxin-antitoxin module